jgi:hypothetical protein
MGKWVDVGAAQCGKAQGGCKMNVVYEKHFIISAKQILNY